MLALIEWLGGVYAVYRMSQDAGMWMLDPSLFISTLENLRPVKDN